MGDLDEAPSLWLWPCLGPATAGILMEDLSHPSSSIHPITLPFKISKQHLLKTFFKKRILKVKPQRVFKHSAN